ncbi:nuclear transport factor 2 family protein [Neorhizobium galegae]|nr:nuclear transport factor 2 family protein [Neorhizobium galegae]
MPSAAGWRSAATISISKKCRNHGSATSACSTAATGAVRRTRAPFARPGSFSRSAIFERAAHEVCLLDGTPSAGFYPVQADRACFDFKGCGMTARPLELDDHIAELLQARTSALMRQSRADMEALLGREFTYINAHGEVCDRCQYLDRYCSGNGPRFLKQEMEIVRIIARDHAVAVLLDCREEIEFAGEQSNSLQRALYIFRKQADRWLWCEGQATELRSPVV